MSGERLFRSIICAAVILAAGWPAGAFAVALHCMNTASGATWDIPVDLAKGIVDSVPAKITDGTISWEDAAMHFYDFDRATGALDMHVASSMGGFYATDRCTLK